MAVWGADATGAVLQWAQTGYFGDLRSHYFFPTAELQKIIAGNTGANGQAVTGGPAIANQDPNNYGTTTDGTMYRRANNSSAVGIKATSGEVEILLTAYTNGTKPTDSHWYTRIR